MEASFSGANQFIPAPNSSLETLIASFDQKGLDVGDLVALSGRKKNYAKFLQKSIKVLVAFCTIMKLVRIFSHCKRK